MAAVVLQTTERLIAEQEQVSNPVGDYGRANLTTYRLPKPYAFPVYNAAQSKQCNVYIPPYSTLAR